MKKARVFAPAGDLPEERSTLLTLSNKYGLCFVGLNRTFKVYLTHDILAADRVDGNSNEIGMNTIVQYIHLKMYLFTFTMHCHLNHCYL